MTNSSNNPNELFYPAGIHQPGEIIHRLGIPDTTQFSVKDVHQSLACFYENRGFVNIDDIIADVLSGVENPSNVTSYEAYNALRTIAREVRYEPAVSTPQVRDELTSSPVAGKASKTKLLFFFNR